MQDTGSLSRRPAPFVVIIIKSLYRNVFVLSISLFALSDCFCVIYTIFILPNFSIGNFQHIFQIIYLVLLNNFSFYIFYVSVF